MHALSLVVDDCTVFSFCEDDCGSVSGVALYLSLFTCQNAVYTTCIYHQSFNKIHACSIDVV